MFLWFYTIFIQSQPKSHNSNVSWILHVLGKLVNKLSGMQGSTLHTRQSSIQKNKYQVSHKHSCISWWWAHSSQKHVEIDKYKYTKKKKIVHQVGLFTRCLLVCCWDYYDVLVLLPLSPPPPPSSNIIYFPYYLFIAAIVIGGWMT